MQKTNLNLEDIIAVYNETKNLHKTAKILKTSHIRISNILKQNNIAINNVGKGKNITNEELNVMITDYVVNHLKMEEISKKYGIRIKKLRNIFKENNIKISKWNGHIKKEPPIKKVKPYKAVQIKKCSICDFKCKDCCGNNNSYFQHLIKEHDINENNVTDFLKEYPDDEKYVKLLVKKSKLIKCHICGKYLKLIDDRHLKIHNIRKDEYNNLYKEDLTSIETKEKLRKSYKTMMDNPNWERRSSSYESEIRKFLDKNNIKYTLHDRNVLEGQEIDILTDNNIGIEFNGCLYHTEWFGKKNRQYHLNKLNKCKENGVLLVQIFEDEYVYNKDIVFNKISHLLKIDNKEKIFGRKTVVKEIIQNEAKEFLNKYHIQGFVSSTVYLGAYYYNKLIGVMLFKQEKKNSNKWELTRFATDYNYICCGIGGKLFNYFIRNYNPDEIKSFADRRWTIIESNNLYTKLGFKLEKFLQPDYKYYYIKDNKPIRFHKFGFRKQYLHKKYNLPLTMTETEMVKELGYDRIWDCGLIKYVWKKPHFQSRE